MTATQSLSEESKGHEKADRKLELSTGPPPLARSTFRLFRSAISRALSTIQKGTTSSLLSTYLLRLTAAH